MIQLKPYIKIVTSHDSFLSGVVSDSGYLPWLAAKSLNWTQAAHFLIVQSQQRLRWVNSESWNKYWNSVLGLKWLICFLHYAREKKLSGPFESEWILLYAMTLSEISMLLRLFLQGRSKIWPVGQHYYEELARIRWNKNWDMRVDWTKRNLTRYFFSVWGERYGVQCFMQMFCHSILKLYIFILYLSVSFTVRNGMRLWNSGGVFIAAQSSFFSSLSRSFSSFSLSSFISLNSNLSKRENVRRIGSRHDKNKLNLCTSEEKPSTRIATSKLNNT